MGWSGRRGRVPREGDEQDEATATIRALVTAIEHGDAGQPDAAQLAIGAVRQMLGLRGFFDDFGVVMVLAVDLVAELEDGPALAELVEMVDELPRTRPPVAARFGYDRGQRPAGGGGERGPDQIEADLHAAIDDARAWRSDPWLARINADLAVWLVRRGRSDEAAEPLRAARDGYATLGATRWSEQLETALAGVSA